MDKRDVDSWLRGYLAAWKAYDREQIESLFADDVSYRFHPYDEPVVGREAVVRAWLGESDHLGAPTRDDPGTYDADYTTVAVDGDLAVATGTSRYSPLPGAPADRVYHNCFLMRFDAAGRCREFTEWYIKRPH